MDKDDKIYLNISKKLPLIGTVPDGPKNKYTFTKTKMLISNNLVEVNFDGEYIQISKLRIVNQIKEPSVATG
ncbi:MAG: hypothetical protein ABH812_00270, partial [bacterium]